MSKRKVEDFITPEIADQMLKNVFDICEVEPNTLPLEDLQSYSDYRRDRFSLQKIFLVIVMLLFLAIPLLFIAPNISEVTQTGPASSPTFHMSVHSVLPVTKVSATIDGQQVPVFETSPDTYSIEPELKGKMLITVEALNHQYTTAEVNVKVMDIEAPILKRNFAKNKKIYLYLQDKGSGIDFKKAYAKTADRNKITPSEYDEKSGLVVFDYTNTDMNVFIPDKLGNTLQLILSPSN